MPEGPSIVIAAGELKMFKGKRLTAISGNNKIDMKKLDGKKLTDIKTWGKHLLLCFGPLTVRIHLLMFGTYLINESKKLKPRLALKFSHQSLNFYTCSVALIEEPLDKVYDWSADIMSKKWNTAKAVKKLKDYPDLIIAEGLTDQDIFSGVGNIIKNEVLYNVKVHPKSKVSKITPAKLTEIAKEASRYSFDFLKWKKADTLQSHWKAYHQKICERDGNKIHKEYPGKNKRGTFFCNTCQKLYK